MQLLHTNCWKQVRLIQRSSWNPTCICPWWRHWEVWLICMKINTCVFCLFISFIIPCPHRLHVICAFGIHSPWVNNLKHYWLSSFLYYSKAWANLSLIEFQSIDVLLCVCVCLCVHQIIISLCIAQDGKIYKHCLVIK